MQGLMMDMPLLIIGLIRHAERHHGDDRDRVAPVEGDIHRYTYRDAHAPRAPAGQRAEGARRARCTTASPRWPGTATATSSSTTRVAGSGAVLHTINPRLFPDQIAWIANHAEDQVPVLRPDVPAAGREARAAAEDGQALVHDRPLRTCQRQYRTCCATRS